MMYQIYSSIHHIKHMIEFNPDTYQTRPKYGQLS